MAWIGRKSLALFPLYRPHASPPDYIPTDWNGDIMRRMFFDPSAPGVDRSLRAYIRAASSGLADFDVTLMPMQTVDEQQVPVNVLESQFGSQLRSEGFAAAAIVMLGGPGAGSGELGGFWARFVMAEDVGVWAMEFMHVITGFADLYPYGGNMGAFDEMACYCGTHPSAYTKAAIQWLQPEIIATYPGGEVSYDLHSIGLAQPPPSGRVSAVRIGAQAPYLMVEARQRVDQFDAGIPSEGVIVYQVNSTDPLGAQNTPPAAVVLLTTTALAAGQSYTASTGLMVQVTAALSGGFTVALSNPQAGVTVPDVFEMSLSQATAAVTSKGLVPVFTGPNQRTSWVQTQTPVAGAVVAQGSTVRMTLSIGNEP